MILVMIMMVIWMMLIVLINRQSTMINCWLLHWKLYAQTTDAEQDLFSNVKTHSTFVKYCPAQNIRPTLIIALKSIPCLQMVLKTISASIRSASKLSPAPYISILSLSITSEHEKKILTIFGAISSSIKFGCNMMAFLMLYPGFILNWMRIAWASPVKWKLSDQWRDGCIGKTLEIEVQKVSHASSEQRSW